MRLIDADALKDCAEYSQERHERIVAVARIDWAPTIDAAPVVHGEWVRQKGSVSVFKCSACEFVFAGKEIARYCPHCGAKMDGDSHGLTASE